LIVSGGSVGVMLGMMLNFAASHGNATHPEKGSKLACMETFRANGAIVTCDDAETLVDQV